MVRNMENTENVCFDMCYRKSLVQENLSNLRCMCDSQNERPRNLLSEKEKLEYDIEMYERAGNALMALKLKEELRELI